MNFWSAFIIGITTGGLTCLAVQGGLLAGILAKPEDEDNGLSRRQRLVLPVAAFLVMKITIYTLAGFGLGWLGSRLQLSLSVRLFFQTLAGLFMIATGLRLFFPRFLPWLNITAPAPVRRYIRRWTKSEALAAPAFLGLLTILIPCGTTQAMELNAVASGSSWIGAGILLGFTIGTAPLFLIIGLLAKGMDFFQRRLAWVTAIIVIGLGLYSINGVLAMTGSSYEFSNQVTAWQTMLGGESGEKETATADTNPVIAVSGSGYEPNHVTVPAGRPVTLNMVAKGNLGCASVFLIPKLKIEQQLNADDTTKIAATFPTPGDYTFSCGMGMYRGTVTAI